MKFLVDMPLSPELAAWLREQGHDAEHVAACGLASAADVDILRYAKAHSRTVITADLDYPRLLAALELADPALILFRDGNWSDAAVVARMRDVLSAIAPSELAQHVTVVERDRIRKRKRQSGFRTWEEQPCASST